MTCSMSGEAARFVRKLAASHKAKMGGCRQIVFAANRDAASWAVVICTLERISGRWRAVSGPVRGSIGRSGFAPPGGKREGDGRTPSGVFGLGTAFGYLPGIDTGMAYRQAGDDDFWVDDVNSPDYNRWVKGRQGAASSERMKRDDDLYKYGIVVEYNTDPVVKGLGSAVFFHVRAGEGEATDGCISMPEDAIVRMLAWLDASRKPVAVMGAETDLEAMI